MNFNIPRIIRSFVKNPWAMALLFIATWPIWLLAVVLVCVIVYLT